MDRYVIFEEFDKLKPQLSRVPEIITIGLVVICVVMLGFALNNQRIALARQLLTLNQQQMILNNQSIVMGGIQFTTAILRSREACR